jgi:hypothetical protein
MSAWLPLKQIRKWRTSGSRWGSVAHPAGGGEDLGVSIEGDPSVNRGGDVGSGDCRMRGSATPIRGGGEWCRVGVDGSDNGSQSAGAKACSDEAMNAGCGRGTRFGLHWRRAKHTRQDNEESMCCYSPRQRWLLRLDRCARLLMKRRTSMIFSLST